MTIIKVKKNENGSHDNQTIFGETPENFDVPDGYAVVPEEVGTSETLTNFPFGEVEVESVDGVLIVTSWTPLPIPEPETPAQPKYTELQLLAQQVTDLELMMLGGGRNV